MKTLKNTLKNKSRLEIRLDPESQELLNSLLARTNLTKTSLIKKALIVYATTLKNGHIFTIRYKAEKHDPIINEKKSEEEDKRSYDEILEDLEND